MSQIIKAMHFKYISKYQGLQTRKLYKKMTKIWIANIRWQPCWILRIVGNGANYSLAYDRSGFSTKNSYRNNKWTAPITAWHTTEVDSAQKIHIETTNEILFLKIPTGLYMGLYFNYLARVPVWDDILTPTIFWPRGHNIVTIYWPPYDILTPL